MQSDLMETKSKNANLHATNIMEESESGDVKDQYLSLNLDSKVVPAVLEGFFNIIIGLIDGDRTPFFLDFMSYLCFEVKNYIGCLIHSFNYIFSREYQLKGGIYQNIMAQNFIDVASRKLHQQFIHSTFWLSKERIYDVHSYFENLDTIQHHYTETIKFRIDFFTELSKS